MKEQHQENRTGRLFGPIRTWNINADHPLLHHHISRDCSVLWFRKREYDVHRAKVLWSHSFRLLRPWTTWNFEAGHKPLCPAPQPHLEKVPHILPRPKTETHETLDLSTLLCLCWSGLRSGGFLVAVWGSVGVNNLAETSSIIKLSPEGSVSPQALPRSSSSPHPCCVPGPERLRD